MKKDSVYTGFGSSPGTREAFNSSYGGNDGGDHKGEERQSRRRGKTWGHHEIENHA